MSSTLETFALERLQQLVNHALAYDPGSRLALEELAGKTLVVGFRFPPLEFCLQFLPGGEISLSTERPESPDLQLLGSPVSLALLTLDADQRMSLAGSGVAIEGDHDILRTLGKIITHLEIDWEQALANLIGDIPAHLAGKAIRSARNWQRQASTRSTTGVAEYLREETNFAIGKKEADSYFTATGLLAEDVDRLAARINKLRIRMARDTGL